MKHTPTNIKSYSFFPGLITLTILLLAGISLSSCDEDGNFLFPLTEAEIAEGLKEALKVGIDHSVEKTNQTNGYYGNPLIKIHWPQEASGAYSYIESNISYLQPLLDEVVLLMNRGAENASEKALTIFIDAITSITITDARNILHGDDNAATVFLNERTFDHLYDAFKPDIHQALEGVGAATIWSEITSVYNPYASLNPSLDPINTDLSDYTTRKALDGLFLLVEEEELKIRTDPVARINDILKRVFGTLDK